MVLLNVLDQWFSNYSMHKNQIRGCLVQSMHTPESHGNHESIPYKSKQKKSPIKCHLKMALCLMLLSTTTRTVVGNYGSLVP